MFLIFFFLSAFLETRVGDSNMPTTSAANIAQPEPAEPELETTLATIEGHTTSVVSTGGESSQPEGLQVFGETAATIVEETSSSIADMIKELSQAGGSEFPVIEAGGVFISAEDAAEGPSQHEDSHRRVSSPTFQPGEIHQKSYS